MLRRLGIRLVLLSMLSSVVIFIAAGGAAAQVDTTLPAITGLTSSVAPSANTWYPSHSLAFSWSPLAGVLGYRSTFDQDAEGAALRDYEPPDPSQPPSGVFIDFRYSFSLFATDAPALVSPAMADLNADGLMDIVGVARTGDLGGLLGGRYAVEVRLGRGDGMFSGGVAYPLTKLGRTP